MADLNMNVAEKRQRFRALHEKGCFIIPNPWDVGSAVRLARMGFQALASTSSGAAWALGKEDGEMSLDEVLRHVASLCAATDLPVNVDFEAGFAATAQELEKNVALLIATGAAGFSIEDYQGDKMFSMAEATDRIRAARQAIDDSGENVMLIARAENFVRDNPDLPDTLKRLQSYSEASADCLYAPGPADLPSLSAIVEAVRPKPVNVLIRPGLRVADLAAIGVRRVSVGGSLARAAWTGFEHAAQTLLDEGVLP